MQEKKQEIYKIHCFYMGKIKKNDNLIIKDLMSSYQSRDLGLEYAPGNVYGNRRMARLLPLRLSTTSAVSCAGLLTGNCQAPSGLKASAVR